MLTRTVIAKFYSRLRRSILGLTDSLQADVSYWRERANSFGVRSVLNLGHCPDDVAAVTNLQKSVLFPLLVRELTSADRIVLDFGCGPGRFTADLAETVKGKAIGVDPIERLLELAPKRDGVEYRMMKVGRIPLPDGSVDVVWVCLVLGGITSNRSLRKSVKEILRVTRPGGLLFLAENTSEKKSGRHWRFRSVGDYQKLFSLFHPQVIGGYEDLGETITVMAGRREFKA